MALRALQTFQVKAMSASERTHYFENFAGFFPDAPKSSPSYGIRVGSTTLMADDTYILRQKFDAFLKEA